MRTDIEVIDAAIELVQRDGGWTKGVWCRDAGGYTVYAIATKQGRDFVRTDGRDGLVSTSPVSFCLEGAIRYAADWYLTEHDSSAAALEILDQVHRLERLVHQGAGRPKGTLAFFNDDEHTSQEDAVLALKKARSFLSEPL